MTVRAAAEASSFLRRASARLHDLTIRADHAAWAQATNITADTEELAADRQRDKNAAMMELAAEAAGFDGFALPGDLARQLELIKLCVRLPVPRAPKAQAELTRIVSSLEGTYGRGRYDGRDLTELSRVMTEGRDPDALLDAWRGWRTIAPPMRANENFRPVSYE